MTPYIGQIIPVAFNFAPVGWLACNGQLISIGENQALYALIGTTYGGDGVNTFGLPNLQGAVVVGTGTRPGLSTYVVGQTGGAETVSLTANQIPIHTHAMGATSATGSTNEPGTTAILGMSSVPGLPYAPAAATIALAASAITPGGGSLPHDNVQPVLCINYIIATEGVFPSQS